MALVTLIGGFVLVSHKLSSERPTKTANEGTRPLGLQAIESRLWEDPFAAWDKLSPTEQDQLTAKGFPTLAAAITNDLNLLKPTNLLLLGVMVSGQPYAEDKESRVRTRYAVGAALGSGGYKPSFAGHIGLAASRWPSSQELGRWKTNGKAVARMKSGGGFRDDDQNFCVAAETNLHLRMPFEDYAPREYLSRREYFATQLADKPQYGRVLVAWLDEEYFEDDPVARLLALFKNEVTNSLAKGPYSNIEWAVIGPRYSDTLRTLMATAASKESNSTLWGEISNSLKPMRLIFATPTAMDEAVVEETNDLHDADFDQPRQAVIRVLSQGKLFKSVDNFACTDKQLAAEALAELSLRGINPATNPAQHLVLISEWDTFFARMAGLAFAAEMETATNAGPRTFTNALSFIRQAREGNNPWPATLHRYSYLQGLDGVAADSDEEKSRNSQKDDAGRQHPSSLEEIRKWTPDANKAEGQAQFDYLARLGDTLGADFRTVTCGGTPTGHGHVAAVGIIGSDVYDTLLILQALRNRLPDAVFFTSGLDARYWHPQELDWSRNLVVLSGYGLRLKDEFQAGVAPFRESDQCAEFLATLSAIGDKRVSKMNQVPPRRFEIGRHGPVDLSVTNSARDQYRIWPHPPTRLQPHYNLGWLAAAGAILFLSGLLIFKSFLSTAGLAIGRLLRRASDHFQGGCWRGGRRPGNPRPIGKSAARVRCLGHLVACLGAGHDRPSGVFGR